MRRKMLVFLALFALVLASVSPVLADPSDQDADEVKNQTEKTAFMGKAFQGTVVEPFDVEVDEDGMPVDEENVMTVDTPKAAEPVELLIDESTRIHLHGGINKKATVASFAVGDRVVVQLFEKMEGDGPYPARAIYLVPGKVFVHFTGNVVEASDEELVVANGAGERTFVITEQTVVRQNKKGEAVAVEDLLAGQKVTVVARHVEGEDDVAVSVAVHGKVMVEAGADAEEEDGKIKPLKEKVEKAKVEKVKPNADGDDDQDDDQDDGDDDDDEQGVKPQGKGLGLGKVNPNRPSR